MDKLERVKIDLRGIILLEAEGKQNLRDFSEVGLSEINYADYLEEVTPLHGCRNTPAPAMDQTHMHDTETCTDQQDMSLWEIMQLNKNTRQQSTELQAGAKILKYTDRHIFH